MIYRPDIDGLRTVAVLPVVFYHAGYSLFEGGFVGVDVFFVISGYLITSLIAAEITEGRFSIVHFYERRVRRIFPALFAMILGTIILGALVLLPEDFDRLGQSATSAATFWANLYFWWTGDYFAADQARPLLHTWSLAVEEQFYIVFPPLLWMLYRLFAKRWIWPIGVLLFGSFALSIWQVRQDPSFTFFWPHVRAWELLIGSILALGAVPTISHRILREIICVAGLGMISYVVFTYDYDTLFPGDSAILPCVGTALFLHAGAAGNSIAGQLLSLRPIAWIGKLSYSLYLWHMPILVLAVYYNIEPLTEVQRVAAIITSLAAAIISFYLVEQPFRYAIKRRSTVFAAGTAMVAGTLAMFAVISGTGGFPWRFSPETLRYAGMMQMEQYFPIYDRGRCFLDYDQGADDYDLDACGAPDPGRRILIWGDSYAANLYPGLRAQADAKVYEYTATSCRPIIQGHRRCDPIYKRLPEIAAHIKPDLIIIGGSWSSRVKRYDDFEERLRESIRVAKTTGAAVIVAGQSPTYAFALPKLAFMFPEIRTQPVTRYPARDWSSVNKVIAAAAAAEGVPFHDFYRQCESAGCTAFLDGEPLHWDGGHMTMTGSLFYTKLILDDHAFAPLQP